MLKFLKIKALESHTSKSIYEYTKENPILLVEQLHKCPKFTILNTMVSVENKEAPDGTEKVTTVCSNRLSAGIFKKKVLDVTLEGRYKGVNTTVFIGFKDKRISITCDNLNIVDEIRGVLEYK